MAYEVNEPSFYYHTARFLKKKPVSLHKNHLNERKI